MLSELSSTRRYCIPLHMQRRVKKMNTMISKTFSIQNIQNRRGGTVVEATAEGPRSRLRWVYDFLVCRIHHTGVMDV